MFDAAFGAPANPLRHLGALAVLCLVLLSVTGIYLYVWLDTSAAGAYQSIERLTREQPWGGGLLRSVHRYAADAFVFFVILHLLREWVHGHHVGVRRYAWLTGVPLLALAYVSGIGGFWLHWDRLGQLSATATAEWLDALAVFGTSFTRNFLTDAAVSDRLFSLFVFVHLGVALLMVLGLWFHLQRLARPRVLPPLSLTVGACGALVLLALTQPVMGQGAAALASEPALLAMDWWLLFVHPLMYATSPAVTWTLVAGVFLLLFAAPIVTRDAAAPVARVDADNCSGCGYCFEDCPYEAITLVSRASGTALLAQVDTDWCVGCGVCVGACPSATPFRSVVDLVPGIDMPQAPVGALRERLDRELVANGGRRIVVFGCDCDTQLAMHAAPDVATLSVTCVGMLPMSFAEYALRSGAAHVVIAGCGEGACEFRLGQRWLEERVAGERAPRLRAHVDRSRIRLVTTRAGELQAALTECRWS